MMRRLLALALTLWLALAGATEINQANEAELDSVKGLGPSATARILQAREKGLFKDWADLMARVKGIKAAGAARLSDNGLTVNGAPYPGTAGAAATPSGSKP
ncbi:MAG: ComEA family DNA-binding protein [Rhodoferax sp.]